MARLRFRPGGSDNDLPQAVAIADDDATVAPLRAIAEPVRGTLVLGWDDGELPARSAVVDADDAPLIGRIPEEESVWLWAADSEGLLAGIVDESESTPVVRIPDSFLVQRLWTADEDFPRAAVALEDAESLAPLARVIETAPRRPLWTSDDECAFPALEDAESFAPLAQIADPVRRARILGGDAVESDLPIVGPRRFSRSPTASRIDPSRTTSLLDGSTMTNRVAFYMTEGDPAPLGVSLIGADGAPADLSNGRIATYSVYPEGSLAPVVSKGALFIDDALEGHAVYQWTPGDLLALAPGVYDGQSLVTEADGTSLPQHFPNDGTYDRIVVTAPGG